MTTTPTAPATGCIRLPGAVHTSCTCPGCVREQARITKLYQVRGAPLCAPTRRAARTRLDTWTAQGYGSAWIASATGLPQATIVRLLGAPTFLPLTATARAILSADIAHATRGRGPSLGTTRRLQALAALGWSREAIHAAGGPATATAGALQRGERESVSAGCWARTLVAWERLSGRPGPCALARANARAQGWAPPLAWDEGDLDDPAAVPVLEVGSPHRRAAGGGVVNDSSLSDCAGWGMTIPQAAARLGVAVSAVEHGLARLEEPIRGRLQEQFARNALRAEYRATA